MPDPKPRSRWTLLQDAIVRKDAEAGVPIAETARKVGRPVMAVRCRRVRRGYCEPRATEEQNARMARQAAKVAAKGLSLTRGAEELGVSRWKYKRLLEASRA